MSTEKNITSYYSRLLTYISLLTYSCKLKVAGLFSTQLPPPRVYKHILYYSLAKPAMFLYGDSDDSLIDGDPWTIDGKAWSLCFLCRNNFLKLNNLIITKKRRLRDYVKKNDKTLLKAGCLIFSRI